MLVLTDPDDPRLDDFRSMRNRERTDALYAEGVTVIERLCESGLAIRSVLVNPHTYERIRPLIGDRATVFVVERDVIREVVGFDLHLGAIALADRPEPTPLDRILLTARRLVLLEGLNDHVNLGAIARSARALGADALVLDPTCTDPWYRRSVRVSMGELLRLPVARSTDWSATLDEIAGAGVEVWALTPDATAHDLYDLAVPERLAIAVGAEGPGLSARTLGARTNVRIPMQNGVDSLNVGHAVAVALAIARPSRGA